MAALPAGDAALVGAEEARQFGLGQAEGRADGADLLASTAAAWGLSLGAGAALGALLAGARLSGAGGSRIAAAGRWGIAFFTGGAIGGAAASLLVGVLPARGYPGAWAIGLIGAGGLAARLLRPSAS